MLAVIFFLLTLLAGWLLVGWLPLPLRPAERLAAGAVVSILLSSWLLFLGGWLLGYKIAVPATAVILLCICILSYHKLPAAPIPTSHTSPGKTAILQLLAFGTALFLGYLAYTHSLVVKADGWYESGYSWSDLPLHMSLMSQAAYQPKFDFLFPVSYIHNLSYPFLLDLYSGILLRLSGNWQIALFLPTLTLLLSLMQLVLSLTTRLLKSVRAAWIHLFLLLASGSAGGLFVYFSDAHSSGWRPFINRDYSNLEDQYRFFFANIVTSHLLPQRGFLFGFTAAMLIILLIYFYYHQKKAALSLALSIGGLVGLLPLAHVHTFFILFLLLGILTLTDLIFTRHWKSRWWLPLLLALALAIPQLYWQFASNYSSGFGHWFLGWARQDGESILFFWIKNWGVVLPFLLFDYFVLAYFLKDRFLWQLYLLALLIFIAVNVRIFQPNVFDNMKFLIYSYWGITLIMSGFLARLSKRWWGVIALVPILFLAGGTGILALARETQVSWQEFSSDELAFAKTVQSVVPSDARVLTSERHNNPVPALTGRKILYGYPGWLWSYGYDINELGSDVRAMYYGMPNAPTLFQKYGITHFIISDDEAAERGVNLSYFMEQYPLLVHTDGWYIFKIAK